MLFAAVTATREERAREFAVMRAVGASGRLLRQVQRAELVGVGLLGAALNVPFLAQGELYLLLKPRWVTDLLLVVLLFGTGFAVAKIQSAPVLVLRSRLSVSLSEREPRSS